MREVDESNTEARRVQIIEAATRCLARSGVAKTSINDICREAGMRSGHLYYYFENKDAVLEAVLLHNRETVINSVEHMLDGGDLVSQIFDVHVKAEQGRLSYGLTPAVRIELECYFQRLAAADTRVAGLSDRMVDVMRNAAESAVAAGRLSKDLNIDTFVDAVALIWQGLSYSRLIPDLDVEAMRRAVQLLLAPWLVGDGAPPASDPKTDPTVA